GAGNVLLGPSIWEEEVRDDRGIFKIFCIARCQSGSLQRLSCSGSVLGTFDRPVRGQNVFPDLCGHCGNLRRPHRAAHDLIYSSITWFTGTYPVVSFSVSSSYWIKLVARAG